MKALPVTLLLLFAASGPAYAAWGQFDSFAAGATRVTAGSSVDFYASYSITTDAWQYGGSDPIEPTPAEGYQEWMVNWYHTYSETLESVWMEAGGQTFSETPTASPGSSHSGSWNFALTFDNPGIYTITLSGQWGSRSDEYYSSESASRTCWYDDPDQQTGLNCDGWNWQYQDYDNWWTDSGNLDGRTLTIEVLPVPEPQAVALMLAGLAGLGWHLRRKRRR